ncbi:gene transfer agent family protein [Qipengyuania sp.]|uniref:gene transfer agent family protein n=1 Tax=Qipengyuania sp. TaxID=2004515 RepID=UPI003AF7B8A2
MNGAQTAAGGSASQRSSNAVRGETSLAVAGMPYLLRPTFDALVRAEEELGPLFALVERAGEGQLRLAEIAALFWHCLAEPGELTRETVGQAVLDQGLAAAAKPLRALLGEILKGSG